MLLMNLFSSVKGLSYSDLPKTDAFFLTVAMLAVVAPPLLLFFFFPICRKSKSCFFLITITPIINFRSVKKYAGDKFDEYEKDESTAFKAHPGNFLALYSGLNMIMDKVVEKVLNEKITERVSFEEVAVILKRNDILTRNGMKKIRFIHWLYNIIISGEAGYVSQKILYLGTVVLWRTQKELNNWLSYESK